MEFRLLGPLEVADHDRTVALGGIRQRSLLPVLMLHADEVVATDPLDADLWGDAPPATATESIQIYVSRLRKELGPDRLDTHSPGYVLRVDPSELDLSRFDQLPARASTVDAVSAAQELRQALALRRGQPLADLAYEPSFQTAIARLEVLRLAALEQRIDADIATGRHSLSTRSSASRRLWRLRSPHGSRSWRSSSRRLRWALSGRRSPIVQRRAGVVAEPLLAMPRRKGNAGLAEGAGSLVVGLSDRWRQEGLGRARTQLAEAPPAPMVRVRRGPRPGGLAPEDTRTRLTWSLTASAR